MLPIPMLMEPQAVGYQALAPYAPDWQLADGARLLAAAASKLGWSWAGTYSERGELRGLGAFGLLLAAIEREPTLEIVLIPSMDHLGASASVQIRLYELLSDTGVRVVFLRGSALSPDLTDDGGEAVSSLRDRAGGILPQAIYRHVQRGTGLVRLTRRAHGRRGAGGPLLIWRVPRPRGSRRVPR